MGLLDWIPVVGDVVNGVANVASTAMTNKANKDIMKEQNQWNLQQWNREADFTREMWNANNEYNDPSKQMQRLTDAGLSPWAAASVMGAGDASAVATPSGSAAAGAQMQAPNFQFLQSATQRVFDNYLAQRKNEAEVRKDEAAAEGAEISNTMNKAYFEKFWKDVNEAELNKLLQGVHNIKYDSALKMQSLEQNAGAFQLEQGLRQRALRKAELEIDFQDLQNYAEKVENKMRELRLENLPAELKAELGLLGAQTFAAQSAGELSVQEAKESVERAAKTKLEAAGVKGANEVAKKIAPFLVSKAESEAFSAENDRYGKYVGFGRGLGEYIKDLFNGARNPRIMRRKSISNRVDIDFNQHNQSRSAMDKLHGSSGYWFENFNGQPSFYGY